MNLGFHATISGGLHNAPLEAAKYACQCFQIFSKNPRGWASSELIREDIAFFKEEVQKGRFSPVVVHTSYLLNLASENAELYEKSVKAFTEEIKRAEAVGADYITTHIGSCGDCDKTAALTRVIKGINSAVKYSATEKIGILFENSARIKSPGGVLADLSLLVNEFGKRFGITLDTCHAFAAGYDLREQKGLNACLKEAGEGSIKVIHLNDSKGALGSGLDRHEHLGTGELGRKGLSKVISHPELKHLPFILETPPGEEGSHSKDISYARKLAN